MDKGIKRAVKIVFVACTNKGKTKCCKCLHVSLFNQVKNGFKLHVNNNQGIYCNRNIIIIIIKGAIQLYIRQLTSFAR